LKLPWPLLFLAHMAAAEHNAMNRSLRPEEGGVGAVEAVGGDVLTVDLAAGDQAVADALWEAATDVGFFQVVNHGIPQSDIDAAFAAAEGFFAQSVEEKEKQSPFAREKNSGYEYMKQIRPSSGTVDQKESLLMTARDGCMDGRWPSQPPELEAITRRLFELALPVGCRIMSLLEPRACPRNEPGTLSKAHTLWGPQGQCNLRMLHYMPMELKNLEILKKDTGDGKTNWRASPHTDWTDVTLLFQRPGGDGLECAPNPKKGGAWKRVPPQEGAIAVNIGDMLSLWSDGRVLSNLHRVRLPTPEECTPPRSRYSIACFIQADKDCEIKSEKHPPLTAGEYILGRIRANFSASANAKVPVDSKVSVDQSEQDAKRRKVESQGGS